MALIREDLGRIGPGQSGSNQAPKTTRGSRSPGWSSPASGRRPQAESSFMLLEDEWGVANLVVPGSRVRGAPARCPDCPFHPRIRQARAPRERRQRARAKAPRAEPSLTCPPPRHATSSRPPIATETGRSGLTRPMRPWRPPTPLFHPARRWPIWSPRCPPGTASGAAAADRLTAAKARLQVPLQNRTSVRCPSYLRSQ